jgi:hypothetical protein
MRLPSDLTGIVTGRDRERIFSVGREVQGMHLSGKISTVSERLDAGVMIQLLRDELVMVRMRKEGLDRR